MLVNHTKVRKLYVTFKVRNEATGAISESKGRDARYITPLEKPKKKTHAHAYRPVVDGAFFFAHSQMGWARLTGKFFKAGPESHVTHNLGK